MGTRKKSYHGHVASHAFNFRPGRAAAACAIIVNYRILAIWCGIDVFVEYNDAIGSACRYMSPLPLFLL